MLTRYFVVVCVGVCATVGVYVDGDDDVDVGMTGHMYVDVIVAIGVHDDVVIPVYFDTYADMCVVTVMLRLSLIITLFLYMLTPMFMSALMLMSMSMLLLVCMMVWYEYEH